MDKPDPEEGSGALLKFKLLGNEKPMVIHDARKVFQVVPSCG
jgi:hypothetical protein